MGAELSAATGTMEGMPAGFWKQVMSDGLTVPRSRPLGEMTAELTRMLGDPDPAVRDGLAFPLIGTWISEGVYDDLMTGLGDGICAGLDAGLGQTESDSIFRRSYSALVLAECIDRDNLMRLVPQRAMLTWGDRLAAWLVREQDLRGFVPGKGWAHAVAHGADALAALARSSHLGRMELTVLLDVIADRLVAPTETFFVCGETDRLALTTMQILQRNLVPLTVLEPWVARIAAAAKPQGDVDHNPFLVAGNAQSFLRSLHLQLALGQEQPDVRSDLLLVLIDYLRRTNRPYFIPPRALED